MVLFVSYFLQIGGEQARDLRVACLFASGEPGSTTGPGVPAACMGIQPLAIVPVSEPREPGPVFWQGLFTFPGISCILMLPADVRGSVVPE